MAALFPSEISSRVEYKSEDLPDILDTSAVTQIFDAMFGIREGHFSLEYFAFVNEMIIADVSLHRSCQPSKGLIMVCYVFFMKDLQGCDESILYCHLTHLEIVLSSAEHCPVA